VVIKSIYENIKNPLRLCGRKKIFRAETLRRREKPVKSLFPFFFVPIRTWAGLEDKRYSLFKTDILEVSRKKNACLHYLGPVYL